MQIVNDESISISIHAPFRWFEHLHGTLRRFPSLVKASVVIWQRSKERRAKRKDIQARRTMMASKCNLFVWLSFTLFKTFADSSNLHIAPAVGASSSTTSSLLLLDATGLGSGIDFHTFVALDIQLQTSLPIWTIYNLNNGAKHFVGESLDGEISCDLIRVTTSNGITVLTGRVHDRANDVYYELKPNASGQDTLKITPGDEMRPAEEPIKLTLSQAATQFSYTTWLRNQFWSSDATRVEEEEEETMIDIMMIWTYNAECAKSDLEVECELTEITRANMEAAILFVMADSNVVHANSETGVTLNLVKMLRDPTNFRESEWLEVVLKTLMRAPTLIDLRYVRFFRLH